MTLSHDTQANAVIDDLDPTAPPQLRERMQSAIAYALDHHLADGDAHTALLGEAAIVALQRAVEKCEERAAALDLLAADALLTSMMKSAGMQGAEAVAAAAETYGNSRLAQLVSNADRP